MVLTLGLIATGIVAATSKSGSDRWHPQATPFYRSLASGTSGASELEHYDTLGELSTSATTVVVAKPADVFVTRVMKGEDEAGLSMMGISLTSIEVLRGQVEAKHNGEVVVEFVGRSGDGTRAALELKAMLAADTPVVFFLRAKGEGADERARLREKLGGTISAEEQANLNADREFYRLVCSQGLYQQGRRSVINPLTDEEDAGEDPLSREIAATKTLGELAEKVRRF